MSKQKDKGRRGEHLIADTLTNNGIPAKRVPMSGALKGLSIDLDGDVRIIATNEKVEVKFRENLNKNLWDWLEDNKYLAIKRAYKEPLIVMPIAEFVRLKKKDV